MTISRSHSYAIMQYVATIDQIATLFQGKVNFSCSWKCRLNSNSNIWYKIIIRSCAEFQLIHFFCPYLCKLYVIYIIYSFFLTYLFILLIFIWIFFNIYLIYLYLFVYFSYKFIFISGLAGFDNPMRDTKTEEVKRHIGQVRT